MNSTNKNAKSGIKSDAGTNNGATRFSAAAERNREAILAGLVQLLPRGRVDGEKIEVLEVGSGTGQHACFFAAQLPDVVWQPSEVESLQSSLMARIQDEGSENLRAPLVIDVFSSPWPVVTADVVYTANTFHIVSEPGVECIFEGASRVLVPQGSLIVYGPFSRDGRHNSEGNTEFDKFLRLENPEQGIRDINWLNQLAAKHGFRQAELTPMPANNFIAQWGLSSQR